MKRSPKHSIAPTIVTAADGKCSMRPMTTTAAPAVDERLWPWTDAGIPAPLKENWLRKYWQRAYKKLGFKDLRLHDLRHCHDQWAVLEGVDEAAVQVALRHTNPEMTRRYTKRKNKGEVAQAVGDALLRTG